jgi:hypothetical protein
VKNNLKNSKWLSLFLLFCLGSFSCSTKTKKANNNSDKGMAKADRAIIITALKSKHANWTAIALQTLKANGITTPKVNIDGEYSLAKPILEKLINRLNKLSDDNLKKLDKSLKHYTSINSPFYSNPKKGWKQN